MKAGMSVHDVLFVHSTIALYPKTEIQKNTFPWENIIVEVTFLRMKTLKHVSLLFSGTRNIIFGTLKDVEITRKLQI